MVSKVLCLLAVYSILLLQGDDRSSNIPNCLSQLQCQQPWLLAFMTCWTGRHQPGPSLCLLLHSQLAFS